MPARHEGSTDTGHLDSTADTRVLVALLWPLLALIAADLVGHDGGTRGAATGRSLGVVLAQAGILFSLYAGIRAGRGSGWLAWLAIMVNMGSCASVLGVRY